MTYHVRLMVKVIFLLLIAVDVVLNLLSLSTYDYTIENLCVCVERSREVTIHYNHNRRYI